MQTRKSFDAVLEATQSLRVRSRERVDWAAVPSCATDIAVEHDEEMERLSLNNRKRQKIDLTVGNVLYKWATQYPVVDVCTPDHLLRGGRVICFFCGEPKVVKRNASAIQRHMLHCKEFRRAPVQYKTVFKSVADAEQQRKDGRRALTKGELRDSHPPHPP